MAISTLTTKQLTDLNIATYANKLNQTIPDNPKSFIRVTSAVEAQIGTGLLKYAADRAKQNLALTAVGDDLDLVGKNYGVNRRLAVATILTATLPGTNGTPVNAGTDFRGDSNNIRYRTLTTVVTAGGVATLSLQSQTPGAIGNLSNGLTLSIGTQIPGMTTTATVTATTTTGTEKETDDVYRVRILDVIRAKGGGGNSADYRRWGQEVAGVERIYPYSGRPVDDPTAPPPARTLYVECTPDIEPNGIAPVGLLNQVRAAVITDPVTGLARQPLGLTDATLWVQAIIRTAFYVEVRGLNVPSGNIVTVKANIQTALSLYFQNLSPFVDGLDPIFTRNDRISDGSISAIIQNVLNASGSSMSGCGFGTTVGVFLGTYLLQPGQHAKLGAAPTYV